MDTFCGHIIFACLAMHAKAPETVQSSITIGHENLACCLGAFNSVILSIHFPATVMHANKILTEKCLYKFFVLTKQRKHILEAIHQANAELCISLMTLIPDYLIVYLVAMCQRRRRPEGERAKKRQMQGREKSCSPPFLSLVKLDTNDTSCLPVHLAARRVR